MIKLIFIGKERRKYHGTILAGIACLDFACLWYNLYSTLIMIDLIEEPVIDWLNWYLMEKNDENTAWRFTQALLV